SARLRASEAARIRGPAHKAIRYAVTVFVQHNVSLFRAVAVIGQAGCSLREQELLHARAAALRRSGEVGVVCARPVLRLGPDGIVTRAAATAVVGLEISRS